VALQLTVPLELPGRQIGDGPPTPFQDQSTQADARVERAIRLLSEQDFRGAVTELRAAATIFEKLNAKQETAKVWNLLGIAYRRMAEYDEAERWLRKSQLLADQIGDQQTSAEALNNIGILNAERGEYEKAEKAFRDSLAISEQLDLDPAFRINTLLNLALAEAQLLTPDRGRSSLERARVLAETIGDPAQRNQLLEKVTLRLKDLPPADAEGGIPQFEPWEVSGFGITACPCTTPCPCRSMSSPTTGVCQEASFVHFDKGHYGAVDLSGLSFAMIQIATFKKLDRWGSLYVSKDATDSQVEALQNIFRDISSSKQAYFGRVVRVDLRHSIAGGRIYTIEIPDLLKIKARLLTDKRGRPSRQTAAYDPWTNVIAYMQNLEYRFIDREAKQEWDFSGRQANFRSFTTTQEMYRRGEMLAQYPESDGFFNARQMQIIKKQKLPMLKHYPRGKMQGCCGEGTCANPLIMR
jgi:Tfp pilus assembly protein PilF